MAYVGTPRILATPRDTLASIIQGEAGGQGLVGMQAVGAVIANRASSNFSGYGTDPVAQATARMQFQGQSMNPSASAYSVADSVLAGNNPDPTGGATYYANPGASSAAWARNLDSSNAVQIGAHYFTDNTRGVPFQPSVTGAATASSSSPALTAPSNASTITTDAGDGTITSFHQNADGSADVTLGGSDPSTSGTGFGSSPAGAWDSTGGFTSLNAAGDTGAASVTDGLPGAISGSGQDFSLAGATLDPGASAASITGGNISGFNAAGPVQASPGLVTATNQVASNTKEGDKAITDGVKTAGQTIGQAITTQSQSWLTWFSDSLLRVFVLIIGIALFAGALYYFGKPAIDGAVAKIPKVIPV